MQEQKTLRVIQITDLHLCSQPDSLLWGVNVDHSLQAVLEHVKRESRQADLILATGDLVQDEGASAYQRLVSFLEPLAIPVYCLPGNHDTPLAMVEVLSSGRVRWQRHVVAGDWQFILLDTSLRDSPAGHLADDELTFLEQTLMSFPQYAMVCLHHHPVSVGSPWIDTMMIDNSADLFAILERFAHVRALIWGHIHQEFSQQYQNIELFATPSTCVQFKAGSDKAEDDALSPGYRWFELHADGDLRSAVERVDFQVETIGDLL